MAEAAKKSSKMLRAHVNLARFPESVKSWRTMSTSRIGAWAASAALLIRVVQEPTWARRTDVGLRPFSLFPHDNYHPNLWNYEYKPLYDYLNIHPPAPAGHTNVSERE